MNNCEQFPMRDVDVIEKLRVRLARMRQSSADRLSPTITLTYAQSIDGCIAPLGGGTLQLSNSKSHQLTHQIRAMHDAILVGIGTVLYDNPRLNVRLVRGDNPQPIVVDSRLRFPLDANLLREPCVRPIIATGQSACDKKAAQLTEAGARVIRVPQQENGLIDLAQLLPILKQLGIHSVMVEGGAKVITSVLTSQIADHLLLAIAPKFVGGMRSVNPAPRWEQMPQLHDVHCQLMDGDVVVWGHLEPRNGLGDARAPKSSVSDPILEC